MSALLVIGQHSRITAAEKKKICSCWFPKGQEPKKRGDCKRSGCFLDWEERWRQMTTDEQKANYEERCEYAKKVVEAFDNALRTL